MGVIQNHHLPNILLGEISPEAFVEIPDRPLASASGKAPLGSGSVHVGLLVSARSNPVSAIVQASVKADPRFQLISNYFLLL